MSSPANTTNTAIGIRIAVRFGFRLSFFYKIGTNSLLLKDLTAISPVCNHHCGDLMYSVIHPNLC